MDRWPPAPAPAPQRQPAGLTEIAVAELGSARARLEQVRADGTTTWRVSLYGPDGKQLVCMMYGDAPGADKQATAAYNAVVDGKRSLIGQAAYTAVRANQPRRAPDAGPRT